MSWRPLTAIKTAIALSVISSWAKEIDEKALQLRTLGDLVADLRLVRMKASFGYSLRKIIGGHINVGPVTFYGSNAMHFAVNIRKKEGYLCLRPPTISMRGIYRAPYIYFSPDGTPSNAKWGWCAPWGYDSWKHQEKFSQGGK